MTEENAADAGKRLNELLAGLGQAPLAEELARRFADYAALLMRWNTRINLTAIRDLDGILRRHLLESIVFARALPSGIGTVLDFGSGAGIPGIPVALCRPEVRVTLAESQGKKVAFLREAVRVLQIGADVYGGRAEDLDRRFDCVGMRAVDRMASAVAIGSGLVADRGWLAVLTTTSGFDGLSEAAGRGFEWLEPVPLQAGTERIVLLGRRRRAGEGREGI